MIELACVLMVDRDGALLLQLRDDRAPNFPNVWGLPGGHVEPGETAAEAAVRELWEESGLRPDGPLRRYARQELPPSAYARQQAPEQGRVKSYFWGRTGARQRDVVLGEGAAMLFVPAAQVLNRPFTPGTAEVLAGFLASPEYAALIA